MWDMAPKTLSPYIISLHDSNLHNTYMFNVLMNICEINWYTMLKPDETVARSKAVGMFNTKSV